MAFNYYHYASIIGEQVLDPINVFDLRRNQTRSSALYEFESFAFNIGSVWRYGASVLSDFTSYSPYNTQDGFSNTDNFNVSSGKQLWTVPAGGNYSFSVAAAGGGTPHNYSTYYGGRGVMATWNIDLEMEAVVEILVGSQGGRYQYTAGGGGATYVKFPGDTIPAVICGAGGGGGSSGGAATNGTTSTGGTGGRSGSNGSNGGAGSGGGGWGSGGSGWSGRDSTSTNQGHSNWQGAYWAQTLANDARGASETHGNYGMSSSSTGSCRGAPGGYGGGGCGQCNGGGGGAGYSGGRAGGGAGGSRVDTSNGVSGHSWTSGSNANSGHGYVTITLN